MHPERTLDCQNTIFKVVEMSGRTWSKVDLSLFLTCQLLMLFIKHAAFYFRSRKRLPPKSFVSDKDKKRVMLGWPKEERKADAFKKVAFLFVMMTINKSLSMT